MLSQRLVRSATGRFVTPCKICKSCPSTHWMKGSVDMLHLLPRLRSLSLTDFHFRRNPTNQFNLHELARLSIESQTLIQPTCSMEGMHRLLAQFTKLTSLKMSNMRNLPFRFIIATFPDLESLDLSGSGDRLQDSDITGISNDDLRQMGRFRGTETGTMQFQTSESVTSLTKLRKIKVSSNNLTNICIEHGLSKCNGLVDVSISSSRVTLDGIKKLLANLPIIKLSFQNYKIFIDLNQIGLEIGDSKGFKEFKINRVGIKLDQWNDNKVLKDLGKNINQQYRTQFQDKTPRRRNYASNDDDDDWDDVKMWEKETELSARRKLFSPFL